MLGLSIEFKITLLAKGERGRSWIPKKAGRLEVETVEILKSFRSRSDQEPTDLAVLRRLAIVSFETSIQIE